MRVTYSDANKISTRIRVEMTTCDGRAYYAERAAIWYGHDIHPLPERLARREICTVVLQLRNRVRNVVSEYNRGQ